MPREDECKCCSEFEQIVTKNNEAVKMSDCEQPPSCITQHPGFQAVSQQMGVTGSLVPI